MPENRNKFYLTTPIYYVNARPHIGHAYTTIVADVVARRHRLLGDDTFFLTGTDEHGQKIERSAGAAGVPPQQFADEVSASFRALWARMGITNDAYIRTTDPAHARGVQKLFTDLHARGFIELRTYTGQYCVSEEMFVEGPPGTIGPDGKPTETVSEENFFFKLSEFQRPLLDLIESDTLAISPESRKNEVLSFLRGNVAGVLTEIFDREVATGVESLQTHAGGIDVVRIASEEGRLGTSAAGNNYVPRALKDLSISRSSFTWGIPVPEPAASEAKEKHVIYVWLDALANYMTAIGYGSDSPEDQATFAEYWPADLHLVGKEIIRFHCVYWPAFLLAANLPLPKSIVAHGWLLFEDSKMSKSRGNIVRTETILDAFGPLCPPTTAAPTKFASASEVVILREAQNPRISLAEPQAHAESHASLKGTASAVPQTAPGEEPALAAEGASGPAEDVPQRLQPHSNSGVDGTAEAVPLSTQAHQDLFAADILRYFLLREIPFGQDGSFSFDALIQRYNSDLANGYGNLVSRTLKMMATYFRGSISEGHNLLVPGSTEFDEEGTPTKKVLSSRTIEVYASKAFTVVNDKFETYTFAGGGQGEIASAATTWGVLDSVFSLITYTDLFLTQHAPWKMASTSVTANEEQIGAILYTAAESIRWITALLYPILPYATASVWRQLGLGDIEEAAARGELNNLQWGGLKPGTKLGALSPIFPRADKGLAQIMSDMESANAKPKAPEAVLTDDFSDVKPVAPTDPAAGPRTATLAEPNPGAKVAGSHAISTEREGTPPHTDAQASGVFAGEAKPDTPQIAIDDFVKIDLRVAQIVVAERIPKADKLLRLEVDLGYEKRQILSGIAEWYTPEELLGRRIAVIANLAPRKMRGLESHGMLLAASGEDHSSKPILASFSDDTPLGSRIR